MNVFDIALNLLIIAWSLTFVGKSVIDLYFYFLNRKISWRKKVGKKID